MPTTNSGTASPAPSQSAFDIVVGFFEAVFNGSADEPPEHKAAVKAIIENAFDPAYTFNGGRMAPDALVGWREAMMTQFGTITFQVSNALSWVVDVGTPDPTTAVCITWTANATNSQGAKFRLNGMNMLSLRAGKAVTNVQHGDAGKGWQRVA